MVWYSVEPIYEGDNIPALRDSQGQSYSGELDVVAEVPAVCPGYTIDYMTGEVTGVRYGGEFGDDVPEPGCGDDGSSPLVWGAAPGSSFLSWG